MSVFGWKEAHHWQRVAEVRERHLVKSRQQLRELVERTRALRLQNVRAKASADMWRRRAGEHPFGYSSDENDEPSGRAVGE